MFGRKMAIAATTFIIGLAFQHPLVMHLISTDPSLFPFTKNLGTPESKTATAIAVSTTTDQKPTPYVKPPDTISTSTSQIGEFTAIVTCKNGDPVSINLIKDGTTTQTINVRASITGIPGCPQAQNQDVNFDNYSDFILPVGNGTGGTNMEYWLFSTSTQEFYCPEAYNDCYLLNPSFNATSKTVTSVYPEGAGTVITDIFDVVGGRLVLTNHSVRNN